MEGPERKSVLYASERAELAAYEAAVAKGKLAFGSAEWTRYLLLVDVQESGERQKLQADPPPVTAPAPVPVTAPSPAKRDARYYARLYFPEANEAAAIKRLGRLKSDGKTHQLPPPLDDPAAMLEWYAEMNAKGAWVKSTRDLLEHLRAAADGTRAPARASNIVTLPAPAAPAPRVAINPDEIERDPACQLRHMENEAHRLHLELLTAQEASETDAQLDTRRTRWLEANSAATQLRTRLHKDGHLIPKSDATSAFRRILHPIPGAMERELTREFPDLPAERIRAAIRKSWAAAFDADILTA